MSVSIEYLFDNSLLYCMTYFVFDWLVVISVFSAMLPFRPCYVFPDIRALSVLLFQHCYCFVIDIIYIVFHFSIDGVDAAAAKLPPVKGESHLCAPCVGSALTCKLANQLSPPMDRCLEQYRRMRWQASRSTTIHHLLSIISVANTLMSMSRSSFTQHSSRDAGR